MADKAMKKFPKIFPGGEVVPTETIPWWHRPFFGLITLPEAKPEGWSKKDEISARLVAAWGVLGGKPIVYHCILPWPPKCRDSNEERNFPTALVDCQFIKETFGQMMGPWN